MVMLDALLDAGARGFRARVVAALAGAVAPFADAVERGERPATASFPALRAAGLLAGRLPREHGGGGLSNLEAAILGVELARACAATAMTTGASALLCGGAIARTGAPEQRARWLPRLASGQALGAWALTEPGAGSDVAGLVTRADRVGDGWELTGQKAFITNAPAADVIVVYARSAPALGPDADPHQGISSFVVERGDAGLSTGPPYAKLGLHGSLTGDVFLDRCRVGPDRLLGTEGLGFYQALDVLNDERAGLPCLGCGLARRALDDAWAALEPPPPAARGSEGPGSAAGSVLARAEARLARVLAQLVAVSLERDRGIEDPLAASALKLAASDMAVGVALEAARALGAAGASTGRAAERALRDAKLLSIGGGTSEIQKTILARRLLV